MSRQLVLLSCCLLLLTSSAQAGSFSFNRFGPPPPFNPPTGPGSQFAGLSNHEWPSSQLFSIFEGPRRPIGSMLGDLLGSLHVCPEVTDILAGHERELHLWLTVQLWSGRPPSQWQLPPVLTEAFHAAIECKQEHFPRPEPVGATEVPVPSSLAMLAVTALTVAGGARLRRRRKVIP